jgi:hypothetical protein
LSLEARCPRCRPPTRTAASSTHQGRSPSPNEVGAGAGSAGPSGNWLAPRGAAVGGPMALDACIARESTLRAKAASVAWGEILEGSPPRVTHVISRSLIACRRSDTEQADRVGHCGERGVPPKSASRAEVDDGRSRPTRNAYVASSAKGAPTRSVRGRRGRDHPQCHRAAYTNSTPVGAETPLLLFDASRHW